MAATEFRVNVDSINLRTEPIVRDDTRLAVLHLGQAVAKLAEAAEGWWRVSTVIDGVALTGFVKASLLSPAPNFVPPEPARALAPVFLRENNASARRSSTGARAYPIGEPDRPVRDPGSPAAKAAALGHIIDWLDVEHSARYRPGNGATYCNIYATDYCYLAGGYAPRVWWTAPAIAKLEAGQSVTPVYATTVDEVNANALTTWFQEYGSRFGWRRTFDMSELQDAANDGKVCIITARRKEANRPGHICAVVPETPVFRAARSGGGVIQPLQSQAGGTNHKYVTRVWWTGEQFREFGFWIHD